MITKILLPLMTLWPIITRCQNSITFCEPDTTREVLGGFGSAIDALISYEESKFIAKLYLNLDLISDDKFKHIYSGLVYTSKQDIQKNLAGGLASVLVDSEGGFEGSINVGSSLIQFSKTGDQTVIEKKQIVGQGMCGVSEQDFKYPKTKTAYDGPIFISNAYLGQNALCLPERKILPIAVACDCNFTKLCGGVDNASREIVKAFAQASLSFERHFNMALGIVEIKAMPECNDLANVEKGDGNLLKWNRKCDSTYTMKQRLSDFSEWQMHGFGDSNPGVTHLITGCYSGSTVGLSWPGKMCVRKVIENTDSRARFMAGSSVSSTTTSKIPIEVIIHELGHVIGAGHDCGDDCNCDGRVGCDHCCPCSNNERLRDMQIYPSLRDVMENRHICSCRSMYVMNPTTMMASLEFSPCSKDEICKNLKMYGGTCLKNPEHVRLISGGVCGNGIKEQGEECDCGSPEDCAKDPCCMDGCKLRPGALCSDSNDKCCNACQIVKREERFVCRKAIGLCDMEETCDGIAPSCPPDLFKPDGTICDSTSSKRKHLRKCASGVCTNRHLQCREAGRKYFAEQECPHDPDYTSESLFNNSKCRMHCLQSDGQCIILTNHYIDGTECGNEGKCRQGQCEGEKPSFRLTLLQKYIIFMGIVIFASLTLSLVIYYLKVKKALRKSASVEEKTESSEQEDNQ